MNKINLARIDLNLLVTFEALMDLRSVTLAAERLGRTPSAISHALARLREQVGDPLMVKVGGKMQPSPFALALIEDIKPLLRDIERVISPPDAFDPATSDRVFRLAVPGSPTLVSAVSRRVSKEAPNVELEWLSFDPLTTAGVVEERIDLGMLSPGAAPPDGLEAWFSPQSQRLVFARHDHPAVSDWGLEAWLANPHVVVNLSGAGREGVQEAVERDGLQRRIGARVTEFSALAPLIARTDNLGTFAPIIVAEDARAFGLAVLEPPIDMPPFSFGVSWSARLANDPAIRWIREIIIAAHAEAAGRTDEIMADTEIVRPKTRGKV